MSSLPQTQLGLTILTPTVEGFEVCNNEKVDASQKIVLDHVAACRILAPSQYEVAPITMHIPTAMLHLSLQKETFEADLQQNDTDTGNSKRALAKYEKVADQIASIELFVIIALINERLQKGESLLTRDFINQCDQLRSQLPKGDGSVDSLVNWFGKLQAEANFVNRIGLDNVILLAPADNEFRRSGISFFVKANDIAFPASVVPADGNNPNFVEINEAQFTTINEQIELLNESPEKNVLGLRRSNSNVKIDTIDSDNFRMLSSLYKFLRGKGLSDSGRLDPGKNPKTEIKGTKRKWFKMWHYLSPKQGIKINRLDCAITQFCKVPTVIYFSKVDNRA